MKSAIYLDEPPADLSRHGHLQYRDAAKYVTVMVYCSGGPYAYPLPAVFTRAAIDVAIQRGQKGMITIPEEPKKQWWGRWLR